LDILQKLVTYITKSGKNPINGMGICGKYYESRVIRPVGKDIFIPEKGFKNRPVCQAPTSLPSPVMTDTLSIKEGLQDAEDAILQKTANGSR